MRSGGPTPNIARKPGCPIQSKFAVPDVAPVSEIGRVDFKAVIRDSVPIAKFSFSSKTDRTTQTSKPPCWPLANCGVCCMNWMPSARHDQQEVGNGEAEMPVGPDERRRPSDGHAGRRQV